jgi:hypothetical protein
MIWPDNKKVKRFIKKFAKAVSNMKPFGPMRRGINLNNLGMYWTRITACKIFLA